jgi:hypothetical protein
MSNLLPRRKFLQQVAASSVAAATAERAFGGPNGENEQFNLEIIGTALSTGRQATSGTC